MNGDMKWYKKLYKILESCYLCIRFPFLYPRNRWTGKHKAYALQKSLNKFYHKSIQQISITGRLETSNDMSWTNSIQEHNVFVVLDKETKKLIISNIADRKIHSLKSLLWNEDKFEILGMSINNGYSDNLNIIIHVRTIDETDKTNYGFHFETIELIKNKFQLYLYNILKWIDSEVLDRILFIPTYTELDAMPSGWRKAFGIQMCKDIKRQLKKEHFLYKYRITQIKEKFGTLRWYDECSSRAIFDIIQKYEDISYNTCICCGKPATKISSGWISPYCDDCFPKSERIYKEIVNGN